MNNQQLKTYYDILTDAWKIIKKYHDVEKVDWYEVAREAQELPMKYNGSRFAVNIAVEVYSELARLEEKEKKQHGN